jgi:hypothetical protein
MAPRDSGPASDEDTLRRLADELFITTDAKEWEALLALFAEGEIEVDMSSLAGGGPVRMTRETLVNGFRAGLHPGKASHHMATNYRLVIRGDRAEIGAQGYAWNRVAALGAGNDLWETWGTYRLTARREVDGWRLDGFRYFSKLTRGDDAVRTHQA